MKLPDQSLLQQINNRLVTEELNYDHEYYARESESLTAQLNEEQRKIYHIIKDSVENKQGKLIFVQGHGGTGKTYLWKTIIASLRSEGKIVLPVANAGIAAQLVPNGRIAHSRFSIPINPNAESTFEIKQGSQLA